MKKKNSIKDQVLSLECIEYLKGLGLEIKDVSMYFLSDYEYPVPIEVIRHIGWNNYHALVPTLTLQELINLLPRYIEANGRKYELKMDYVSMWYEDLYDKEKDNLSDTFFGKNLLFAGYYLLCWVLEQGFLERNDMP